MTTEPTDTTSPTTEKPTAVGWLAKRARRAAQVLKDEYEAGKRGDETPAQTIWATPREQLDAVMGMMKGAGSTSVDGAGATEPVSSDDADQVAGALGGVDWAGVRAATADRTGEAARAARAMADQVDWGKVQPAAQKVSKALIAAVACGQIPVVGPFGSLIARAIVDQGGMARRVGGQLEQQHTTLPADVDAIIETTARET
ncbi:MAG: hypothetical protein ABIR68_18050 [Ilumatobacteraceae bacterium]